MRSIVLATIAGVSLGTLSGYYGHNAEMLVRRIVAVLRAFPRLACNLFGDAFRGALDPHLRRA